MMTVLTCLDTAVDQILELQEKNSSLRQTIATLNESLRITSEGNFKLREQLAECERERDELTIALANCANRAKQAGWKQGDSGYADGLQALAKVGAGKRGEGT
jgi:septal ring factor EnvC (AmiA/AmiB activator)